MEWITAWLDGIPGAWLRVFALAGPVGLFLGAYQMVTGWRANRLLKKADCRQEKIDLRLKSVEQFLINKFGKRSEIQGQTKFDAPEMTATVKVRKRKKDVKKPAFLLTLRRFLGKLFP